MVRHSADRLKRQWRERAAQRRSKADWATTDFLHKGGEKAKKETDEEVISPGSVLKLALGERFKSVEVHITMGGNSRMRPNLRSEWQQKLCKVLVDVCLLDGSTEVNSSAIKETPNHLSYLQLEVHGNRTFVGNLLQWREIGFIIEIKGRKNELVRKYFAINLHPKRFRRSSGGSLREGTVPSENANFPDYDQHKCCGGCWSGCSPVAWAQVFGYYDRLASSLSLRFWAIVTGRKLFSPTIYKDSRTNAPLSWRDAVKPFVEDIRSWVQTFCDSNGNGATYTNKMHYIAPWFRARQGHSARVVSYLESRKRRSIGVAGSRVEQGSSTSWIESKGVEWLRKGYPVVFIFRLEGNSGHSAVATQYRERSKYHRHCSPGSHWDPDEDDEINHHINGCSYSAVFDYYEFFLHYGWGGKNNKRQKVSPFAAHVAYLE